MSRRTARFLLILGLVLVVSLLLYFAFATLMPGLWPLLEKGDSDAIENYLLSESTFTGMLCMALLQFVQVVSIVIPGAPIQIAGGIVYGIWRGFIICHLSFVSANAVVFRVARRFGNRMEELFPSQNKKGAKLLALLNSSDPAYMTALASLMPGIPNGIIPYAAAHTNLTFPQFITAVYLGSAVPILIMCAIGKHILNGDFVTAILSYAIMVACILLLFFNRVKILNLARSIRDKHRQKA